MRTAARSSTGLTHRLSAGVGWISLALGIAMTLDPRRSADVLGWAGLERLTRLVGAADLILGAGLLLGRHRAGWMLARALLNAAVCLVYARVLAGGRPRRGRAGAGVGVMAALTALDYSLSRKLRLAENL